MKQVYDRRDCRVIGMLVGAFLATCPFRGHASIWMEVDQGIGTYDYIEKDATTWIHYGVNWSSWNRTECWVDVGGLGAAYSGSWQHDDGGNKHLSTGNLSSGNHGDKWVAGSAIDVYAKIDDNGSDPWNEQASYVDEWLLIDVVKSDVSGDLERTQEPHLVLQFSVDVASNAGREITRLWVANAGTLQEGSDIPNAGVALYYENGTTLDFDGDESAVTLYGDYAGNAGDNEEWGSNALNLSVPSDGNKLLCYVCITNYASSVTYERTAKFKIISDGLSLDQFGSLDKKLVRIDAHENANALTLHEAPRGMLYLIR
jgi:hypothetical protein